MRVHMLRVAATSIAFVGLCALGGIVSAEVIADSVDDWSPDGIQGENGWFYGYYNRTLDLDEGDGEYSPDEFIPFINDDSFEVGPEGENHWDGTQWRLYRDGEDLGAGLDNTGPWTRVGEGGNANNGHPNGENSSVPTQVEDPIAAEHWVMRRWESDYSGPAEVTVGLEAVNLGCGNGTTTFLFHNGTEIVSIENTNDPELYEETVSLTLAVGDFLDYGLSPLGPDVGGVPTLGNDWCDSSSFPMQVSSVEGGLPGDFDGDGVLDLPDVNMLNVAIQAGSNEGRFDVNGDTLVNVEDLNVWVKDLRQTWFGDANLDGEFNSGDLVAVFQAGKFEFDDVATWNEGDWNGDLRFGSGDLVKAFQDGGFEAGPVAAVPEPSSLVLALLGTMVAELVRRQRLSRRRFH